MILFKKIFTILIFFFVVSCYGNTEYRSFVSPSGKQGYHIWDCDIGGQSCLGLSGQLCPNGYQNLNPSYSYTQLGVFERIIECK